MMMKNMRMRIQDHPGAWSLKTILKMATKEGVLQQLFQRIRSSLLTATTKTAGSGWTGSPPTAFPENQEFTPDCNNEDCRIRVDWEPPPRDTWMSCLLGYRVGFRKDGTGTGTEDEWTW